MNLKSVCGFSLIELMVVIAIVATLAAIATPIYKDYTTKTKVTTAMTVLNYWRDQVSDFYNRFNRFPSSVSELGYANGGLVNISNGLGTAALNTDIVGEAGFYNGSCAFVESVAVGPCVWVVINSSLLGTASHGMLALYLAESSGALRWGCYTPISNPIPTRFLPAGCVAGT